MEDNKDDIIEVEKVEETKNEPTSKIDSKTEEKKEV